MDAFVDEKASLENNTLSDGEPVQIISQRRGDMIKLPPPDYQPSSSIEHQLQPLNVDSSNTNQNAITVVQVASDRGMDQCFGGIKCE